MAGRVPTTTLIASNPNKESDCQLHNCLPREQAEHFIYFTHRLGTDGYGRDNYGRIVLLEERDKK